MSYQPNQSFARRLAGELLDVIRNHCNGEIPSTRRVDIGKLKPYVKEGRGYLDFGQIRDIVQNFNPLLFGVLLVSRRRDGTLVVIDGNHRLEVALRLGLTDLPVIIIHGLTAEQEHAVFALGQSLRKNLSAKIVFHQAVEAGSATACEILETVVESGFRITKSSGSKANDAIDSVQTLQHIYNRPNGRQHLRRILETISRAWGMIVPQRTNVRIFRGLDWLFTYADHIDDERLVTKLSQVRPANFWINAPDGSGRSVAENMLRAYNERLRSKRAKLRTREEAK